MLSLRYRLLRLFYAALDKYNQRREAKAAAERARNEAERAENEKRAIARREYKEREETQNFLFLALLQTMCKVCEQLKPLPWVHKYGGWNPGWTVRALYERDNPVPEQTLYEIHRQITPQYYNIEVRSQDGNTLYDSLNLFVSEKYVPYVNAVFDLTARRNISSSERAQNLEELKNIEIKKSRYWDSYPEAQAIKYLEGLLSQNQSK